jgi:hypothetical protein
VCPLDLHIFLKHPLRIQLFVSFSAVVSNAQHLTVFGSCFAAFAPCHYVVGVHFFLYPDFRFSSIFPDGAQWTDLLYGFGCFSLLCVKNRPFRDFVKHANIQELLINGTVQDVFKNSTT